MKHSVLIVGLGAFLCTVQAWAGPAERTDARGDRIENRLDERGDRIENRLDRRGDRVDRKL